VRRQRLLGLVHDLIRDVDHVAATMEAVPLDTSTPPPRAR
jgi:hypothetical protein